MASLFAASVLVSHAYKQDIKVAEYATHVEYAEHVEDVQTHDVHLDSSPDVQNIEDGKDEPPSSLLTLPVEIRLRIYEMAYDATFRHSKLDWEGGLQLQLQGTPGDYCSLVRAKDSPFSLLRVCRRLYCEVSPMLPSISSIALRFNDFSEDDMKHWLELLDDSQIAQMRSFTVTGWETCQLRNPLYVDGHRLNCHRYRKVQKTYPIACTGACGHVDEDNNGIIAQAKNGLCDRSLTLDLNAFERQFQAERFERIVSGVPLGVRDPASHREFHKACYLLRVLDGCVSRPTPKAHPGGRDSQCGTWDIVEAAVASFVGDDGSLVVTKGRILGLLRAAMGCRGRYL